MFWRVAGSIFFSVCAFAQQDARKDSVAQSAILLGVLEDVPGHYADEPHTRAVRVVFQKSGADWQPFRSDCPDQDCLKTVVADYPREVTWTIAFDGRNLGQITSRAPEEFELYSSVGLEQISSTGAVPIIGKRSPRFGGFTEESVYRPLVANSQPYFTDPAQWKPFSPAPDLLTLLRRQFRKQFPKLCREAPGEEGKLEPFAYRDDAIRLVKAYTSKTGVIAQLHLEAVACDDTEAEFNIGDPWFAADSKESVQYLDSGMWLVDAGDYDNDGKSELMFSIDRYNEGGYELFYDGFAKRAVFSFHYH